MSAVLEGYASAGMFRHVMTFNACSASCRLTVRDTERGCHTIEECVEYSESEMDTIADDMDSRTEPPVRGEDSNLPANLPPSNVQRVSQ